MAKTSQESVSNSNPNVKVLRVAGSSEVSKVAGAIVSNYDPKRELEVMAIGAGAVNQAVKAIASARGMIAPTGVDLYTIPALVDVYIDDVKKTAVCFKIRG